MTYYLALRTVLVIAAIVVVVAALFVLICGAAWLFCWREETRRRPLDLFDEDPIFSRGLEDQRPCAGAHWVVPGPMAELATLRCSGCQRTAGEHLRIVRRA